MKNIATINLLVSLLLATAAIPGVVSAANEEVVLEEVVVTAQRREQSLQDVPVAVTALSADAIARQNIKSATDYLMLTPNVSYTEDGQFGKRGAGVSIRGVNNLVSGENATIHSIGVYLDEFSVASVPNQFANPQLPDMERIEVLRGPQGTFFGRNAVGGALNLTTQNPQDDLHGKITMGGESYDDAGGQWSPHHRSLRAQSGGPTGFASGRPDPGSQQRPGGASHRLLRPPGRLRGGSADFHRGPAGPENLSGQAL